MSFQILPTNIGISLFKTKIFSKKLRFFHKKRSFVVIFHGIREIFSNFANDFQERRKRSTHWLRHLAAATNCKQNTQQ